MRIEFERKHVHDENVLKKMEEAKFLAEEQNEKIEAFYLNEDEMRSLIIEGKKLKLWPKDVDESPKKFVTYRIEIWGIPVYEE